LKNNAIVLMNMSGFDAIKPALPRAMNVLSMARSGRLISMIAVEIRQRIITISIKAH